MTTPSRRRLDETAAILRGVRRTDIAITVANVATAAGIVVAILYRIFFWTA